MLTPKVITAEELKQQKEEELKNTLKQLSSRDPYEEPTVLERFVGDVEKFDKYVDGLTKHTLNGPTPLDKEWKVRTPRGISYSCIAVMFHFRLNG